MTRLERKIKRKREELAKLLLEQKNRREAQKAQPKKKTVRTGRPPISPSKLQQIELDAYSKPLPDVALKHGVSLKTLYNYNITRSNLNAKIKKTAERIVDQKKQA